MEGIWEKDDRFDKLKQQSAEDPFYYVASTT